MEIMKRLAAIICAGILACSYSFADNKVQQAVNRLNEESFADCCFSTMIRYVDGEQIACCDPRQKMNPASNMKVITTGAALTALGPEYRWETTLAYTGSVTANGRLNGDLYIIGGGDPMLGSKHADAIPMTSVYAKWADFLAEAGISQINGDIIGDGSWLDGMREDPSWSFEDLGTYYGTCLSGLNFYENRQGMRVNTMGAAEGSVPEITLIYPSTPWMKWQYDCTVGGKGDNLYMYWDSDEYNAVIRGTIGAGLDKTVEFRNNRPELTLACEFKDWLEKERNIIATGSAKGITDERDSLSISHMAGNITEIGSSFGPDLRTVINRTNKDSNNLFAEMLFRTVGKELGRDSSPESAREAMMGIIGKIVGEDKASRKYLMMQDGSGLSVHDRVSASFMCDFLASMYESENRDAFVSSLKQYSSRCVLKTGTISGCRSLCGYILPATADGRAIVFSIMVNNSELRAGEIDKLEKSLLDIIVANCR